MRIVILIKYLVALVIASWMFTLPANAQSNISPDEARAIAQEAYVYGFPFVEGYKTLYKQAVDKDDSDFRAPFNVLAHARDVATPEDTFVVTPNSDTPYSFGWLDLRAEPIVITMPKIEEGRYYSVQLIGLQTFNFDYLGTRALGNSGGEYLIVGPNWNGEKPAGITAVMRTETQMVYALFRTQLHNSADIEDVRKIQDRYKLQTLSAYLGKPAPMAAPAIDWPKPSEGMTEKPSIFGYLNFLLQFAPTHSSEKELMERFAKLGIGAGMPFDIDKFSPEVKKAVEAGVADVWKGDFPAMMKKINAGEVDSGDLFGTREFLKNNYLYRFVGAKLGLYGNTREEAFYPTYFIDSDGNTPDASQNNYELRFEKGQFPPANAFWSLTMYDGKSQFLVANPLDRYLMNSAMTDTFNYGDDGSLTLYLSKDSPGADKEANWLPAPDGPFYGILRIYYPKPEGYNGEWKHPPLIKK